jgi:hypothetical protein
VSDVPEAANSSANPVSNAAVSPSSICVQA